MSVLASQIRDKYAKKRRDKEAAMIVVENVSQVAGLKAILNKAFSFDVFEFKVRRKKIK